MPALREVDPHEYPGLEAVMRQVGDLIAEALPPDVGCALFTFHFGEGGGISYMSNSDRSDMIAAIREWLSMQEGGAR